MNKWGSFNWNWKISHFYVYGYSYNSWSPRYDKKIHRQGILQINGSSYLEDIYRKITSVGNVSVDSTDNNY